MRLKFLMALLIAGIMIVPVGTVASVSTVQQNSVDPTLDWYSNYQLTKIQEKMQIADLDGNKIADFSTRILDKQNVVDNFLVQLRPGFVQSTLEAIDALGFKINTIYPSFNLLNVNGNLATAYKLAALSDVLEVEENMEAKLHLAYSTAQMNVRPGMWDAGLTTTDTSIAILDTGIDDTHYLFAGKIVAWQDFVGKSADISGDNYATATDMNGHGTHVASIAAGSDSSTSNTFSQSSRGQFPSGGNFYPVATVAKQSSTMSITVGLDWGNPGSDGSSYIPKIYLVKASDPSTAVAGGNADSSGLYEHTYTVPADDYIVFVGNGNEGDNFEAWVTAKIDPRSPVAINPDGYGTHNGVSPGANIVAVKVMDDDGSGYSNNIIDGLQWVINNRDVYNITVVNLSLGFGDISPTLDAAVASTVASGIIVVASAGNDGPTSARVGSPGSEETAITVGAVNRADEVAYYSSKGNSHDNPSVKPDILAPGGSYALPPYNDESSYYPGFGLIFAADSNDVGFQANPNDFTGYQGTSMASPHIAGLANLLAQEMKNMGTWQTNLASAMKVKQVILGSAAEVANIGFAGGEHLEGGTDPTPTIGRTVKDFYEGWGMVNGMAALNLLSQNILPNINYDLTFGLNDPFTPNSYGWKYFVEQGKLYTFDAIADSSVDVDIYIMDASPTSIGDINFKATAISSTGGNETLAFTPDFTGDVLVSVKLVDSANTKDTVQFKIVTDFTPNVTLISPTNGSYIAQSNFPIEFDSVTHSAEVFFDGTDLGIHSSGDLVNTNGTEGRHNLTLVETNQLSGTYAKSFANITFDFTNPMLSTNITAATITDSFGISYSVTDNYVVDKVEVEIEGSIIASSNASSGSLQVNPLNVPFGNHTVYVIAYDAAGNNVNESAEINFNHQLYIVPHDDVTVSKKGGVTFTWDVGSKNPQSYSITVNSKEVVSEIWDGSSISYTYTVSTLGNYTIVLQLTNADALTAQNSVVLSVVDKDTPEIILPMNSVVDATNSITAQIKVRDEFTHNITIVSPNGRQVVINSAASPIGLYYITEIDLTGNPNTYSTIDVYATDDAGNTVHAATKYTWRDLTAPKITAVDDITYNLNEQKSVTISITEQFNKIILVEIDGTEILSEDLGTASSYELVLSDYITQTGTYNILIQVTDVGNNIDRISFTATVNPSVSTAASFLPLANTVFVALTVGVFIYRKKSN